MVKGATAAERAAARAEKKRRSRRRYFAEKASEARNGREKLQHACRLVFAVGENEMDDDGRARLAREVVLAVERVTGKVGDRR